MQTSLTLQEIADSIIKYEQVLTSSHSKIELAHAEKRIEELCEGLTAYDFFKLDDIIQEKMSKSFA